MAEARADLASLADDQPCYVPGFGETTLGAVRNTFRGTAGTEDDATVRMWVLIVLYDPKAKPWRTGRIRVGSQWYPLSECLNDRLLPLSKSSRNFIVDEG
jgi:hypothetical protein